MNKTYTTISEFVAIIALKTVGEKKKADTKYISEQLRIMRTLLNKAGVDIYRVIGTTPKEVFTGKSANKEITQSLFVSSNN